MVFGIPWMEHAMVSAAAAERAEAADAFAATDAPCMGPVADLNGVTLAVRGAASRVMGMVAPPMSAIVACAFLPLEGAAQNHAGRVPQGILRRGCMC